MRGGCPLTVSLMLSVLSEDVCEAFSFESSMLYSKWHVKWNLSDNRVRVNCKWMVLRNVSLTKGNCMSWCIVVFFTYLGAPIAILRILFIPLPKSDIVSFVLIIVFWEVVTPTSVSLIVKNRRGVIKWCIWTHHRLIINSQANQCEIIFCLFYYLTI